MEKWPTKSGEGSHESPAERPSAEDIQERARILAGRIEMAQHVPNFTPDTVQGLIEQEIVELTNRMRGSNAEDINSDDDELYSGYTAEDFQNLIDTYQATIAALKK